MLILVSSLRRERRRVEKKIQRTSKYSVLGAFGQTAGQCSGADARGSQSDGVRAASPRDQEGAAHSGRQGAAERGAWAQGEGWAAAAAFQLRAPERRSLLGG